MTSKLSLGLVVLPFVPSSIVQGQEQEVRNERPNIIFIMSDDHARQAMSIYGHPIGKVAPTPNIDRIGHEGAVSRITIVAILFPGRVVLPYLRVNIAIKMVS